MRAALPLLLALLAGGALADGAPFPALAGMDLHLPITPLRTTRQAGTVLQEYDFSCGSAAIATLLTFHYGHAVSEEDVLRAMYAHGDQPKIQREGFSMLDMKRYLESLGYAADGFRQSLDKLAEARLPAIVLLKEGSYYHFVVVKGLLHDTVLLGDPARGTRTMRRQDFNAAWVDQLLFVIHNRTQEARFNQPADWRAAPRAPLWVGMPQEGLAGTGLPRGNPGDF